MSYSRELVLRVLSLNPKNSVESRQAVNKVLKDEGYDKNDPESIGLRIEMAKEVREILQEKLRRAS